MDVEGRERAGTAPFDKGRIRLEQDNYVVDVSDGAIENPDEAYLTTFECETWEQVERYCRECDGKTVI